MRERVIETTQITKKYGKVLALDHVDICVKRGDIYGLIGDNGAGKSTLLKLLAGHSAASTGEIRLFGEQGEKELQRARRRSGVMIEQPGFFGNLTVENNMEYYRIQKGVPGKEKVEEMLRMTGIWEKRKCRCKTLSMGMKQRLGLAGALLGNPKLLILDEPTNGLDPAGIQEMRELICALPKTFGMTVMVSSHLLNEIEQMADHIGVISKGELVFQDRLKVLHDKSKSSLAVRTLDNEAAKGVFQKHGIMCREEGAFLLLPELSDQELSAHIFHLFHETIGVVRLEERKKTLEEIFIELTGTAVSL